MSQRNKPTIAFWITVVVVSIVLYLFSVGPVAWALNRFEPPDWVITVVFYFYYPIVWAENEAPDPIRSVTRWYLELWV